MKKNIIRLTLLAVLIIGLNSCSKCYDCSYVTEIESNGQVIKDTVTDEFCTASSEEVKEKENQGQTCVAK